MYEICVKLDEVIRLLSMTNQTQTFVMDDVVEVKTKRKTTK